MDGEEEVPVINAPQVVRCRRCRTYINPWVSFVENNTRWKCNMCFLTNDVPSYFDWDESTRSFVNRMSRPELTHSVVEYIAPQEYMVRPPQPVIMLFIIDVTYASVQSGMVAVAAKAILDALSTIPNSDGRTKVGFISYDSSIHFYNMSSGLSEPQMLVVPDLQDTYLPIMPFDLLVGLSEGREMIESFLKKFPSLFQHTTQTQSVLGKALRAGQKLINPVGGKMVVLCHTLPNLGEGALKARDEIKLLGTAKESGLLQPSIGFYKSLAVDCSPSQISIDMFLFNATYADVATLSGCAKFTGGSTYYYPKFNGTRREDAIKFASELGNLLSRPLALEAVMRVRYPKGITATAFHGNFFLRSSDLLSLPNVNPDNSYAIELSITDNLNGQVVCFQTALLHTSSNGERRIRVLTLALPITTSIGEVFASVDQVALTALLAKKAVERALSSKIDDAREAILYKVAEIAAFYRTNVINGSANGPLVLPESMKLLPVLTLAMIKNVAFRASAAIPIDLRSYYLLLHYVFSPELIIVNMYPRFWNLATLLVDEKV